MVLELARPSVPWCFAVSESPARTSLWSCFEGMGAALWSWFPVGSEGNVRQWSLLARRRFCSSVPWCFAVSESPAGTSLWSCFEGMGAALWSWFLVGLKATLGSGACLLGAASVLQCHGVLLFRNRPQATESVEKCVFLGFQTTLFFWRGFGTSSPFSSSFRGMVFRPREVIFSKLFYC